MVFVTDKEEKIFLDDLTTERKVKSKLLGQV